MKTSNDTNTLWVSGWMWGKYPEQAASYHLPQDETEAAQWREGFRWGTTEACQFHQLWELLDETLTGHEPLFAWSTRLRGIHEL